MQATTQDMIGFALSNTTPVMTLWGGRGAALGNNPIAIGVPTNGMPLVLDMAVSKVAGGKVRLAAKQGKKIPADWVTDDEGTPTDDPQLFDQGIGALLPAGTKGYGLGIMVEVLAGVLAGARIMDEIPFYQRDTSKTVGLGHMFIAMKVDAFAPIEAFRERMDDLINRVHDAPKAKGVDSIYLPGELEHLCQQTREVSGIQVPEPVYADLMAVADRLELSKSMLESSDS
jgi:LDH2 family malate/lactate/ureidoglycolate dehydrogenase